MLTLFHIFAFIASLAGLVLGVVFGFKYYGWIGGVFGAILCAYAGLVLGRLLRALVIFLLGQLDKKTIDKIHSDE